MRENINANRNQTIWSEFLDKQGNFASSILNNEIYLKTNDIIETSEVINQLLHLMK